VRWVIVVERQRESHPSWSHTLALDQLTQRDDIADVRECLDVLAHNR
jgi:hypothetical protein